MNQRLEYLKSLLQQYTEIKTSLSEKERRLWAAKQAKDYGRGGITLVCQATGMSTATVCKGIKELKNPSSPSTRIRATGGGRKKTSHTTPDIHPAILSLMSPKHTVCQHPPFLWSVLGADDMAGKLREKGYPTNPNTTSVILREQNYFLRSPHQPYIYASHSEIHAQCRYIYLTAVKAQEKHQPFLYVIAHENRDTPDLINAAPPFIGLIPCDFGDISREKGWNLASIKKDNTAFILQALQTWWRDIGCGSYRGAEVITLVTHGYNKDRKGEGLMGACPWQQALQQLACDSGLSLRVRHLPPCTFRWNNILHKTTTYSVCEGKILAVTLYAIGLSSKQPVVSSFWDSRQPPALLSTNKINIKRDKFHPEWNYGVKT